MKENSEPRCGRDIVALDRKEEKRLHDLIMTQNCSEVRVDYPKSYLGEEPGNEKINGAKPNQCIKCRCIKSREGKGGGKSKGREIPMLKTVRGDVGEGRNRGGLTRRTKRRVRGFRGGAGHNHLMNMQGVTAFLKTKRWRRACSEGSPRK